MKYTWNTQLHTNCTLRVVLIIIWGFFLIVQLPRNLNRSNTFVFAINVKEVAAMILTLREKRGKFLPSKHYEPMP